MAENESKWGKAQAKQRYGSLNSAGFSTSNKQQENQFPEDAPDPKYDNSVTDNWLRGNGVKPGFDRGNP